MERQTYSEVTKCASGYSRGIIAKVNRRPKRRDDAVS